MAASLCLCRLWARSSGVGLRPLQRERHAPPAAALRLWQRTTEGRALFLPLARPIWAGAVSPDVPAACRREPTQPPTSSDCPPYPRRRKLLMPSEGRVKRGPTRGTNIPAPSA